ncbi:hypothetical protein ACQR35_11575 [Pseudarthrobacter sp. J1738]|uniref:hypothetical protein n=1 Tax=unclassified Pseudarthrobacter TaxID=2647000 RepID=UPI003D27635F
MSEPIIIMTEEVLGAEDRANISELLDGTDAPLHLLVPADTERHLLVDFLDHLSLLEFAEAFRELSAKAPNPAEVHASAQGILDRSLTALAGLGSEVSGEVSDGDPVDALVAKVRELGASQAVVITRPHAVADTFRTDWANRAQQALGLPVLHLYAGSGFIGDS